MRMGNSAYQEIVTPSWRMRLLLFITHASLFGIGVPGFLYYSFSDQFIITDLFSYLQKGYSHPPFFKFMMFLWGCLAIAIFLYTRAKITVRKQVLFAPIRTITRRWRIELDSIVSCESYDYEYSLFKDLLRSTEGEDSMLRCALFGYRGPGVKIVFSEKPTVFSSKEKEINLHLPTRNPEALCEILGGNRKQ